MSRLQSRTTILSGRTGLLLALLVSAFYVSYVSYQPNIVYRADAPSAVLAKDAISCQCDEACPVCPALELKNVEIEASSRSKYWDMRKSQPLYTQTVELAREEAPFALTALDVGAYESPFLSRFDWIPTKVATDIQSRPQVWNDMKGIAFIQGDFMQLKFGTIFDLVLCTQVVEHLPDDIVGNFVQKMTRYAKVLIVSTTYEMHKGTIEGHIQDPISEEEFRSWFENTPEGKLTKVLKVPSNIQLINPSDGVRKPVTNIIGIWKRD